MSAPESRGMSMPNMPLGSYMHKGMVAPKTTPKHVIGFDRQPIKGIVTLNSTLLKRIILKPRADKIKHKPVNVNDKPPTTGTNKAAPMIE